jgi:hypothetical protein
VNTSIIGSNGVLNRVSEDGVLPDWFRHPHHRFGTTHRLIDLIVILQIVTILISRGDVYILGEAYAFGVMWSFFMKSLSVLVLRYKQPEGREWKVPLNFRIRNVEIPVGLGLITISLFFLAVINVITKKAATISGVTFTLVFFAVFELSERYHKRKTAAHHGPELEKFRVEATENLSSESVGVRPGNVIVAVRNPNNLDHLRKTLEKTDTRKIDIVALSVRLVNSLGSDEYGLEPGQIFADNETQLFSKVVTLAEKAGKPVKLLAAPGTDPNIAGMRIAELLQSSRIVAGRSAIMSPDEQARLVGLAWEKLPEPRPSLSFEIILEDGQSQFYNLGPHPPRLWPEDVELAHQLWLKLGERFGAKLHHRDVMGVALRRMAEDLHSERSIEVIEALALEVDTRQAPKESDKFMPSL